MTLSYDTDDQRLDDLLRTLDAAEPRLDLATERGGKMLLENILATPSTVIPLASKQPPPRRRWLLAGAAAAVVTLAATTIPGLLPTTPAYGTWTATPIPVTGETRTKAVDACQKQLADSGRGWKGPERPKPLADTARTVLAEQRGQVILVSLVTDNDSTYTCAFDAERPDRVSMASGGIATEQTPVSPPLAAEQLRSFGWGYSSEANWAFADTTGRVGADVRAVTIHANGTTFDATLEDGIFAAWWPAPVRSEPMIIDVRFDVTLADGRVLTTVDDGMARGPRPGPREIGRVERGAGVGPDGDIGTAGGLVGSEVVGVTVHADGQDTVAEVSEGIFRASWPLAKGTADHQASTEPSDTRYTLALRDGTVLENVRPVTE